MIIHISPATPSLWGMLVAEDLIGQEKFDARPSQDLLYTPVSLTFYLNATCHSRCGRRACLVSVRSHINDATPNFKNAHALWSSLYLRAKAWFVVKL